MDNSELNDNNHHHFGCEKDEIPELILIFLFTPRCRRFCSETPPKNHRTMAVPFVLARPFIILSLSLMVGGSSRWHGRSSSLVGVIHSYIPFLLTLIVSLYVSRQSIE